MGYDTSFWGEVTITPPLSEELVEEINDFADSDHREEDGLPGIWCQWLATDDGTALVWDEGEKFYESVLWMDYIIQHFIAPNGHVANGLIGAQGEESDDRYDIIVQDNKVSRRRYVFTASDEEPIDVVKAEKAASDARLAEMLAGLRR